MTLENQTSPLLVENGLSKPAEGRLRTALNSSPLQILGGNRKVGTEYMNIKTDLHACDKLTQNLLEVFLAVPANLKSDFTHLDQTGLRQIAHLAEQLTTGDRAVKSITLRTVFGATERKPFRAFQYLLPALHLAEQLAVFQQKNVYQMGKLSTRIEFVFMDDVGATTNGLRNDRVLKSTIDFVRLATEYIQQFHPEMGDQIHFLDDQGLSHKLFQATDFINMQRRLAALLEEDNELNQKLQTMESHHLNETVEEGIPAYLQYAALHPLLHDYVFNQEEFVLSPVIKTDRDQTESGQVARRPDLLISVGAQSEATFYQVRQHALETSIINSIRNLGLSPIHAAQYIANINVPPYLQLAHNDLFIDEVIENPDLLGQALPRSRTAEEGLYQIPVQKSVAALLQDIRGSSHTSLFELETFFTKLGKA